MSGLLDRRVIGTLAVTLTLTAVALPVRGQNPEVPATPPGDALLRVGPLAVSPVLRLTDFGTDSNVKNVSEAEGPQEDVTATVSPEVDAWLQFAHARVSSRSQLQYYYYKDQAALRGLDSDVAGRLQFMLNRLTPYVGGSFVSTEHRQSLENDAIARRRIESVLAGADVRLTDRIFAGTFVRRARLDYDANQFYQGSDLARELNHDSDGVGVTVRYRMTPFTTLGVDVENERDRFEFAQDRDSESTVVTPSIELNPLALVSGRASIGYRRSHFLNGTAPDFNGVVALADLTYTLLGRTRFRFEYRRQLSYSYLVQQPDYLDTGETLSVTQRLGDSWNVGGNIGYGRIGYRETAPTTPPQLTTPPMTPAPPITPVPPPPPADETGFSYGGDLGYDFGHLKLGVRFDRMARDSEGTDQSRSYRRIRIGTNLTYAF